MNGDVYLIAEAGERLVDRVVHDFVDDMMQTGSAGRPDVHGGTLSHRFKAFENLDFVGAVVVHRAVASGGWSHRRPRLALRFGLFLGVFHACPCGLNVPLRSSSA